MITVKCRTLFDVTETGVVGHFRSSRVPFQDRAGQSIINEADWNRSRNQQRNWETLLQLISMRTNLVDIVNPIKIENGWEFEFSSETPDSFGPADNPTKILCEDAEGVPMLRELGNNANIDPFLITDGVFQNIWFTVIPINNV